MNRFMNFFKKRISSNPVFFRTFAVVSIITFLPLSCISLLFSNMAERFWRSERYLGEQQNLIQYVNDVENRIGAVREECYRLSTDTTIISFILNPTFTEINRNSQIMKSLKDVCMANNGVDEACLFSNYESLILTSDGNGLRYRQFPDKAALDVYQSGDYQPMVHRTGALASPSLGDCITFYQNIPEDSIDNLGCLILNMKKDFLFSLRSRESALETAVLDSSQQYLYISENAPKFLSDDSFMDELQNDNASFTYKDYLVLKSSSSATGWTFAGLVPMPLFLGQYQNLSRIIMYFAVFALLFSLLTSFFAAKKIHQPLKNLVALMNDRSENADAPINEYKYIEKAYSNILKENHSISTSIDEMRPTIKNSFFFSLLLNEPFSEEEIQNKLLFIGENFTQNGYALLLFAIDSYETFTQTYSEAEQSMYNYQFTELVNSESALCCPHALIRMNLATWTLVLNISPQDGYLLPRLEQIFSQSVQSFPYKIYVVASSIYDSLSDISYSLREAQETLNFHKYQTGNMAPLTKNIKNSDREQDGSKAVLQPVYNYRLNAKLEESLLQAIRSGSVSSMEGYYNSILNNIRLHNASFDEVSKTASYIMDHVIEIMILMGIPTRDKPQLAGFYEQVQRCRTVPAVQALLKDALVCATSSISIYNRDHSDKNIERLLEYIHTHLNEDISLTNLAEICQMSPSYVSRLFKKHLNIGFVEYLNRLRIQRAEQLLKETAMTVEQIGYQVGFTNIRNFMRVFKQYKGISPGQYRAGSNG